jgi:hypothetical protein
MVAQLPAPRMRARGGPARARRVPRSAPVAAQPWRALRAHDRSWTVRRPPPLLGWVRASGSRRPPCFSLETPVRVSRGATTHDASKIGRNPRPSPSFSPSTSPLPPLLALPSASRAPPSECRVSPGVPRRRGELAPFLSPPLFSSRRSTRPPWPGLD